MCGRYVFNPDNNFSSRFDVETEVDLKPNYNVAPGSIMPVIVNIESQNKVFFMRWGFIPMWAEKLNIPREIINARAETLAQKNSFKQSLQFQRCIIPASGFYEWKKDQNTKIPFYFYIKDQPLFSFAGLFNEETYTIITTTANDNIQSIHDRMPVILTSQDESKWLTDHTKSSQDLTSLLKPYQFPNLDFYQVSTKVNKTTINTPQLIKPI